MTEPTDEELNEWLAREFGAVNDACNDIEQAVMCLEEFTGLINMARINGYWTVTLGQRIWEGYNEIKATDESLPRAICKAIYRAEGGGE